jgi:hypothetical protein
MDELACLDQSTRESALERFRIIQPCLVRHGRIVVEAYYAPYAAGIPHAAYSVTKSVISTLTAGRYIGFRLTPST